MNYLLGYKVSACVPLKTENTISLSCVDDTVLCVTSHPVGKVLLYCAHFKSWRVNGVYVCCHDNPAAVSLSSLTVYKCALKEMLVRICRLFALMDLHKRTERFLTAFRRKAGWNLAWWSSRTLLTCWNNYVPIYHFNTLGRNLCCLLMWLISMYLVRGQCYCLCVFFIF